MKFFIGNLYRKIVSRPLHRGRGLKYGAVAFAAARNVSPPTQGAWIEIHELGEILTAPKWSPPTQGAWIEMTLRKIERIERKVAPCTGGVDCNLHP